MIRIPLRSGSHGGIPNSPAKLGKSQLGPNWVARPPPGRPCPARPRRPAYATAAAPLRHGRYGFGASR